MRSASLVSPGQRRPSFSARASARSKPSCLVRAEDLLGQRGEVDGPRGGVRDAAPQRAAEEAPSRGRRDDGRELGREGDEARPQLGMTLVPRRPLESRRDGLRRARRRRGEVPGVEEVRGRGRHGRQDLVRRDARPARVVGRDGERRDLSRELGREGSAPAVRDVRVDERRVNEERRDVQGDRRAEKEPAGRPWRTVPRREPPRARGGESRGRGSEVPTRRPRATPTRRKR